MEGKQEREEGWRESESEKRGEVGARVTYSAREGTCRRISLGSGVGLFNERAHSTPPSLVAPAGWGPQTSGSPVGAPACSITAERRGELRMEIYFLSLPVEQPAHLHTHMHRLNKN